MQSKSPSIKSRSFRRSGFTIIEIVAYISLVGILGVIVETFFLRNLNIFYKNDDRMRLVEQATKTFSKMTPKLRNAMKLDLCSPNSLSLYYLTGDDLTAPPDKITYSLNQTSRQILESTTQAGGAFPYFTYTGDPKTVTIGESVVNDDTKPLFQYFDSTGQNVGQPCDPSKVTMVEIDLRNRDDGHNAVPEIENISKINFRNAE